MAQSRLIGCGNICCGLGFAHRQQQNGFWVTVAGVAILFYLAEDIFYSLGDCHGRLLNYIALKKRRVELLLTSDLLSFF